MTTHSEEQTTGITSHERQGEKEEVTVLTRWRDASHHAMRATELDRDSKEEKEES